MKFWCASLSTPSDGLQLTWHPSKAGARAELRVMKQTYYPDHKPSEWPDGAVNCIDIEPTRAGLIAFLNENVCGDG